jgi:hypothetical protein
MSWEAIGAVGELIGAVAVVVSVVYLAVQVRHNTGQLKQQGRNHELTTIIAIETCFSNFRALISGDAQVAALWHRALENLDALAPEERTQAEYLFREFFWSWANLWIKVDRGDFLTFKVDFDSVAIEVVRHVRRKGIQQWWSEPDNRALYFPGFAEIVDQMIQENPVPAQTSLPSP